MKDYSRQSKGAVTLTIAGIVLFSGLWALWYIPSTSYDYRKNEQITNVEVLVKPQSSTSKTFDVKDGVQEITAGIFPQTVVNSNPPPGQQPPDIPPVISARILDPKGAVVRAYDNAISVSEGEHIAVQPGTYKLEVFNNSTENDTRVQLRIMDVTKIPNHPLDATGQWLTIISLPVFGLAAWFIIFRSRQPAPGSA